ASAESVRAICRRSDANSRQFRGEIAANSGAHAVSTRAQNAPAPPASNALERLQRWALAAGALGLVAAAIGFSIDRGHFFEAYLVAYLLWLGIALGCLGMSLLHGLTGGYWGAATRNILAAGAGTIPLLAILFFPIAAGLPELYVWTHEGAIASSSVGTLRQVY